MPTLSRLPSAAGQVAMLLCAASLVSCGPNAPSDQQDDTVLNNAAEERPALPIAEAPLDRERLLLAVIRAASAYAAGTDDSTIQRPLDGKRFELRLRIGCGDAEGQDESRGWRFDEERRTLRLRVTPDLSGEDPTAARLAGEEFEGVEGLWLRSPWLLTAACQKPPSAPAQTDPDSETADQNVAQPQPMVTTAPAPAPWGRVGIAQFFAPTDSRTGRRRQRPYETTKVLGEGQRPSAQGYDFVVSGRLRALPDKRVIACSTSGPGMPPACIISVDIDRTWIEHPDNGELLAEWRDS